MKVAYINCLLSKGDALGIEKKLAAQGKAIAQPRLNLEVFYFNFHQVLPEGAFSFQPLEPGFPHEILLTLS
jgi:hypothetical protein